MNMSADNYTLDYSDGEGLLLKGNHINTIVGTVIKTLSPGTDSTTESDWYTHMELLTKDEMKKVKAADLDRLSNLKKSESTAGRQAQEASSPPPLPQANDNNNDNNNESALASPSSSSIHKLCRDFLEGHFDRGVHWFIHGLGTRSQDQDSTTTTTATTTTTTDDDDTDTQTENPFTFLVISYPRVALLWRRLDLPPKKNQIVIMSGKEKSKSVHQKGDGGEGGIHSRALLPPPLPLLSQSQPKCLNGFISSPLHLLNAAEEMLLGGKPHAMVIGNNDHNENSNGQKQKKHKRDHIGSNSLLRIAEYIFCREQLGQGQGQGQGRDRISESTSTALSDTHHIKFARDVLRLQCQIMGHQGDFQSVLQHAELFFQMQQRFNDMKYSNVNDNNNANKHDDEESERCLYMEASVLGYKGFSLIRIGNWSDAYPCLERSYEIRTLSKKDKRGGKSNSKSNTRRMTYLQRQSKQESIAVEKMLAICCKKLGISAPLPPLTVFPRTSHLFDSGGTAVSSDDLVISGDSALFRRIGDGITQVIVEEKIDGANMGFTLSATGAIIPQNRNHFVSAGDHSQFGPLTSWMEVHRQALVQILSSASNHTNRAASQGLILFGEWMVAKHSIPYHQLPSHFVAFDIYDRLEQQFYSRARFHNVMVGTGIPVVPVIRTGAFGPYSGTVYTKRSNKKVNNVFENDLRRLLNTKSLFRTDGGYVEGVVLRIDETTNTARNTTVELEPTNQEEPVALWLEHRAKIVRPDFVRGCHEGHWTRRAIEKQTVNSLFAEEYMSSCAASYSLASSSAASLSSSAAFMNGNDNTSSNGSSTCSTTKDDIIVTYETSGEVLHDKTLIDPSQKVVVRVRSKSDGALNTQTQTVLPRNFSFLWANEVAFSSKPCEEAHISAYKAAFNISLVISLTMEEPLPSSWFDGDGDGDGTIEEGGCTNLFVPVKDYTPPSQDQIKYIIDATIRVVLDGGAVLIHCAGGRGRTGTIAACLFAQFGPSGIRQSKRENDDARVVVVGGSKLQLHSEHVIEHIRKIRPGSIETPEQERTIGTFISLL